MGYIFGSGTKFVALTSGLAVLMTLPVSAVGANQTAVAPAVTATIDIAISNLRSEKGDVLVCLSSNPKYFPDCRKDKTARKMKVAASDAANVQFTNVEPGTYAVALVHDENANGKMDLRLFLPREGFGFSRNPKIGMGPPKFKSAQFTIGADNVNYAVKMKYIL
ncbi:hypothetical protein GCM10009096_07030 [Parasphingorhabdus litoris]|uniref:DUF2141 domain-containing protein n=2 Tax=Parasphingorhabdus litoris TaxID=394733 RepID=A0ABN1A6K1_9SPHN